MPVSPASTSTAFGVDVVADAVVARVLQAAAPCWRPSGRDRSCRAACAPAWHVACRRGRARRDRFRGRRRGRRTAAWRRCSPTVADDIDVSRPEPAAGLDDRPRPDPPGPQRRLDDVGARVVRAGRGRRALPGRRRRAATPTSRPVPAARRPSRSPTSRRPTPASTRRSPRTPAGTAELSGPDRPGHRGRPDRVHALARGRGPPPRPRARVPARGLAVASTPAWSCNELTMRWNARRPMGLTGLPPEALAVARAAAPGVAARAGRDRRPRRGGRALNRSSSRPSVELLVDRQLGGLDGVVHRARRRRRARRGRGRRRRR